jgi:hypothetical protein
MTCSCLAALSWAAGGVALHQILQTGLLPGCRLPQVFTLLRPEDMRHFKALLRKLDNNTVRRVKLEREAMNAQRPALAGALQQAGVRCCILLHPALHQQLILRCPGWLPTPGRSAMPPQAAAACSTRASLAERQCIPSWC